MYPMIRSRIFAYITMLTRHGLLFVAGSHFAPNNLQELIALAKAKPDQIKYGFSGGTQVDMLRLAADAGVTFFKVPYKTGAQALTAVLSGEVDFFATILGTVLPHIKAGKLKPLFIGSRNRSQVIPG